MTDDGTTVVDDGDCEIRFPDYDIFGAHGRRFTSWIIANLKCCGCGAPANGFTSHGYTEVFPLCHECVEFAMKASGVWV